MGQVVLNEAQAARLPAPPGAARPSTSVSRSGRWTSEPATGAQQRRRCAAQLREGAVLLHPRPPPLFRSPGKMGGLEITRSQLPGETALPQIPGADLPARPLRARLARAARAAASSNSTPARVSPIGPGEQQQEHPAPAAQIAHRHPRFRPWQTPPAPGCAGPGEQGVKVDSGRAPAAPCAHALPHTSARCFITRPVMPQSARPSSVDGHLHPGALPVIALGETDLAVGKSSPPGVPGGGGARGSSSRK